MKKVGLFVLMGVTGLVLIPLALPLVVGFITFDLIVSMAKDRW